MRARDEAERRLEPDQPVDRPLLQNLASGILAEQREWVVGEMGKNGVNDAKVEQDGEWISVTVKK